MVFCIAIEIKYLFNPADINITSRFPISPVQMFLVELMMIYLYLMIISTLVTAPIMLFFGWSCGLLNGVYVGKLILVLIFMPIVPFALATIISTPIMWIMTLLKNLFVVKLILYVLIITGLFVAYNYVLDILADYYIHQKLTNETIDMWTLVIEMLNSKFNILAYCKNIMFKDNIEIVYNILYCLAIFLGGSGIGILLAVFTYGKIRRDSQEGNGKFFSKKTKLTNDNSFIAIFKKELVEIVRTQTYSFFYLGIAITTPVMVFLVNRLMNNVGQAQIGSNVCFGVSVLVLCAFMAMINSFTATSISREGKAFYITKMAPIKFKKQLLAKGLLNIIVSIGALLISIIIIATLRFVNAKLIVFVFFTALISAIGMVFNGYLIDMIKPKFVSKVNGEISETNLSIMLFIGLIVSAIEGGLSIVLSYLMPQITVCGIVIAVAFSYAIINAIIFFVKSESLYGKIEGK